MTAFKKTNSKTAKSPAPATNSAAPKSRKKVAAAPKIEVAPPPAVPVSAPPPAPASAPISQPAAATPASATRPTDFAAASALVKVIMSKPIGTTIAARIDVGYGNTLYLRGEGPGLRWDEGIAMNCVASDKWTITLPESARAYTFKFLLNDVTWSTGPDFTAASGTSVTLMPTF